MTPPREINRTCSRETIVQPCRRLPGASDESDIRLGARAGQVRTPSSFPLSSVEARDSPIPPPAFFFARDYVVVSRSRLRLSGADATVSDVSNGLRRETKPPTSPLAQHRTRSPPASQGGRKGGERRVGLARALSRLGCSSTCRVPAQGGAGSPSARSGRFHGRIFF